MKIIKGKSITTQGAHINLAEFVGQLSNLQYNLITLVKKTRLLIHEQPIICVVILNCSTQLHLFLHINLSTYQMQPPSVTHARTIILNSKITLSNVLYIPNFKCNLLYISTLA